ncbi:MAG: class III signal peptide-containing protein [Eggerthellaceae bacterium]|nr:class III signal peptide-containing protein [Eggerthellaceae bacterium]
MNHPAKALRKAKDAWSKTGIRLASDLRAKLSCAKGQGTTEYAILVGVLVVIAILAISVFKPKLQELWTSIADGINSL